MKECTYKPELNKNSLRIAEKNRKRSNCIPTMHSFRALNMEFPIKKCSPQNIPSNIKFKQQLDAVKVPV
jgi:hypothetical protein